MNPPDCAAFERVWQAVLDGERPAADLAAPHAQTCRPCRDLAHAAELLLGFRPELPAAPKYLTHRIVAEAVRADRRERWGRHGVRATLAAVAAGFLVAVSGVFDAPKPLPPVVLLPTAPEPTIPDQPPVPKVGDVVAGTGSALASLTRRATELPAWPTRAAETPVAAPAPAVAELPAVARTGVEPIAAGTRRALNLFLRDTGMVPKVKS